MQRFIKVAINLRFAECCGNCKHYNGIDCTLFEIRVKPRLTCDYYEK